MFIPRKYNYDGPTSRQGRHWSPEQDQQPNYGEKGCPPNQANEPRYGHGHHGGYNEGRPNNSSCGWDGPHRPDGYPTGNWNSKMHLKPVIPRLCVTSFEKYTV